MSTITQKQSAAAIAHTMRDRLPEIDGDYCGFSYSVGRLLAELCDRRDFHTDLVPEYLAFGILDHVEQARAELEDKMRAEIEAKERETRTRLRLATVDGVRVDDGGSKPKAVRR